MAMKDLIPWTRGRDLAARRNDDPFLTLHREMNRLFDDVFRGFDRLPLAGLSERTFAGGWPSIELSETDKELKVTAELPGLEEKDVEVGLRDGVLSIAGEKRTETEDKERLFSERFYGRFERRIPVEGIDEERVGATFKNGVLTVTLPKSRQEQSRGKRIAINSR